MADTQNNGKGSVFKQAMNWSAYQDKQLSTLQSIDKSLNTNLSVSKQFFSSMQGIERSITAIAHASENSAKNIMSITQQLTGSSIKFTSHLNNASKTTSYFSKKLGDAAAEVESSSKKREKADSKTISSLGKFASNLWDAAGKLAGLGKHADNLSAMSNNMIKLSGMNGDIIRGFRADIMSVVNTLNASTGYIYNPTETYGKIIGYFQGVTSNLSAIEEMARPILLTQEGLNADIHSVAEIFNRFYTRYSFSSASMEEVLNEISGNTAGNSANAEATLKNIQALESWINHSSSDNKERTELLKKTSNLTSWLESMNLDSAYFTNFLKVAAGGDWQNNLDLHRVFMASGTGITSSQATELAQQGDYEVLVKALMQGIYNTAAIGLDNGSYALTPLLSNLGLDTDTALTIYDLIEKGNFVELEKFMKSTANSSDLETLVESKYVSAADKTNNILSNIYTMLANWQEKLGIGLSDVAVGALLFKGVFGRGGSGGGGSGGGAANIFGSLSKSRNWANQYGSGVKVTPGTGVLGFLEKAGANLSGGAAAGSKAAMLGGLGIAGVAAGVGMGAYGISQGIDDIKSGDKGHGISNIAGGALGVAGAGALTAGMLGVGAANAWNPVGWALLIGSAVTLVATAIHKAVTKIGSAEVVEAAYEQAALSIKKKAKEHENALLEVKLGIKEGKDLEEVRRDLINSGILSAEDQKKLTDNWSDNMELNKTALENLTEAYLKATKQWSKESDLMLNEYKLKDIEYASKLHGGLEEKLQEWNDSGKLTEGSEELAATETLLFDLYQSLQGRVSGGEELDKDTKKVYDKMVAAFSDGTFTSKDANSIIDAGMWNTLFQNASFKPEELIKAVGLMSVTNSAGANFYNDVTSGLGTYYGAENTAYVADVVNKIKSYHASGVSSVEEVTSMLEDLKSKGFTSSMYKEIGEAAALWGISGYATGTNYVPYNQLALIHEGEAIVPKKYNPAANTEELKRSFEQSENTRAAETREARESMNIFISELKEIKEFMKEWKEDSTRRDRLSELKNKNSLSTAFISSYMNV